jgi:glycosyltransferase involved in cell wall biosynthesis
MDNHKKNIVIIQNTTLSEHYGLSSYLQNIVKYLSLRSDLAISLICLKGNHNKVFCPKNVKMYEIEGNTYSLKKNLKFFWQSYLILKKISQKERVDIIHCLYPNSSVAAAVLFKIIHGKTVILYDLRSPWIHISIERGSINRMVAPIYKFIAYLSETVLSLFVDRYIFITKGLYNFYRRKIFVGNKPLKFIPSGIDVNFFRPYTEKPNKNTEDIIIGYVGGISKLRKLDEVIHAFSNLPNEGYKLVIVGDGNDKENLEHLVDHAGMTGRVIFTGQLNHDKIVNYLYTFDVGICHLPNTFVFRQSSPMKILEYLASGIPVLASDILTHQEISKVFPQVKIYEDLDDLTEKMRNARKTEKNVPESIKNYDWTKITEQIAIMYH